MDKTFIEILQKLISEQGKEALLNETKCMALLADYTKGEFKKECRLLAQARKAGTLKAINTTQELTSCKKQQAMLLHEDYGMDKKSAADIVNALAFVLRGDTASEETQAAFECGVHQNNNKATGTKPKFFNDYINSGNTYFWKGEYKKAIDEFSKAKELEPDNATSYICLGQTYHKIGGSSMESLKSRSATGKEFEEVFENYRKATEAFKKAHSLDPDNETTKKWLQLMQGQLEADRKYFEARTYLENTREDMLRTIQSLMDMGVLK